MLSMSRSTNFSPSCFSIMKDGMPMADPFPSSACMQGKKRGGRGGMEEHGQEHVGHRVDTLLGDTQAFGGGAGDGATHAP